MTAVAFDGRFLATDSLVTLGSLTMSQVKKLHISDKKGGFVCGMSGHVHHMTAFMEFMETKGDYPKPDPDGTCNGFSAIVIYMPPEGDRFLRTEIYEHHSKYPLKEVFDRYVLGTGGKIALGAMAAGANAEEAVRIASKYDTCTGGSVRVFDTKEWEGFLCKEEK